jgi:hypothetical protein
MKILFNLYLRMENMASSETSHLKILSSNIIYIVWKICFCAKGCRSPSFYDPGQNPGKIQSLKTAALSKIPLHCHWQRDRKKWNEIKLKWNVFLSEFFCFKRELTFEAVQDCGQFACRRGRGKSCWRRHGTRPPFLPWIPFLGKAFNCCFSLKRYYFKANMVVKTLLSLRKPLFYIFYQQFTFFNRKSISKPNNP